MSFFKHVKLHEYDITDKGISQACYDEMRADGYDIIISEKEMRILADAKREEFKEYMRPLFAWPVHKLYHKHPTRCFFHVLLKSTKSIPMIRLELTMGRDIPDNGTVTDLMMDDFIRTDIMPLFEYGTFIDGEGIWKGQKEQTKIFYIEVADSEVEDMMLNLNCVAASYKKKFRQDSVLISQVQTNAIFN